VEKLLTRAMSVAHVVVVTNAEAGWVELSAGRFMPRLLPLLRRLEVVSARSTYEAMYPDSPGQWKVQAFAAILARSLKDTGSPVSVLSFGDSASERMAVHRVTEGRPRTFTKSVKFVERPSVETLRRQIECVSGCFEYLTDTANDLDLMLTIQLLYQ
jgi:hypothetical protein